MLWVRTSDVNPAEASGGQLRRCRLRAAERIGRPLGSAARLVDFEPERSDVDFLVAFEPAASPSLGEFFALRDALAAAVGRPHRPRRRRQRPQSIHPRRHRAVGGDRLWTHDPRAYLWDAKKRRRDRRVPCAGEPSTITPPIRCCAPGSSGSSKSSVKRFDDSKRRRLMWR